MPKLRLADQDSAEMCPAEASGQRGWKKVTTKLSYNELSLCKGPWEAFQGEKKNNGELLKHLRIAEVVVLGDADGVPLQLPSCFFCLCPKLLFNTFYFQVNFYESESSTFSGHWVELWGFREILYQSNQERALRDFRGGPAAKTLAVIRVMMSHSCCKAHRPETDM